MYTHTQRLSNQPIFINSFCLKYKLYKSKVVNPKKKKPKKNLKGLKRWIQTNK